MASCSMVMILAVLRILMDIVRIGEDLGLKDLYDKNKFNLIIKK